MSGKFKIEVEQIVTVDLRSEKFTDDFMAAYRKDFYPFYEKEEHAEHIGQLVARGMIDEVSSICGADQIVEGYGRIGDFVLAAQITETEVGVTS